jgi:hypothetical protein
MFQSEYLADKLPRASNDNKSVQVLLSWISICQHNLLPEVENFEKIHESSGEIFTKLVAHSGSSDAVAHLKLQPGDSSETVSKKIIYGSCKHESIDKGIFEKAVDAILQNGHQEFIYEILDSLPFAHKDDGSENVIVREWSSNLDKGVISGIFERICAAANDSKLDSFFTSFGIKDKDKPEWTTNIQAACKNAQLDDILRVMSNTH